MDLKKFLHQALQENQFKVSEAIENALLHYLELLQKWNKTYNLTAITEPKEMVLLHIIDSLMVNPYLVGTRILDAGTGAGLPGIPLALLNPDKHFVLMDSNNKKIRFLQYVIGQLKLQNVEAVHARLEKFSPQQCFDSIVSRAFASLQDMLNMTGHLICPQGQFLAMKGIYPEKELADISPPFSVVKIQELKMQGLEAKRHLVCIKPNG